MYFKRFKRQEALYIHAAEDVPRSRRAREIGEKPRAAESAAAREHGAEKLNEDRKPRPLCAAESAANGVPVAPALRDTLNALAEELGCAARI